MDDNNVAEVVRYLKAVLVLKVQNLNKGDEEIKPELLLARAGLQSRDIAQPLGKNQAAVAQAIQRAGKRAA